MRSLGNEERKCDLQRWETSRFSRPVSLLKGFKSKKFLFVVSRLVTCNSDVMLLASGQPQLNLLHIIKMVLWAPNRQKEVKNTMFSWDSTNGELFKTLAAHNVSLSATHRNSQWNSLHVIL